MKKEFPLDHDQREIIGLAGERLRLKLAPIEKRERELEDLERDLQAKLEDLNRERAELRQDRADLFGRNQLSLARALKRNGFDADSELHFKTLQVAQDLSKASFDDGAPAPASKDEPAAEKPAPEEAPKKPEAKVTRIPVAAPEPEAK